MSSHSKVGYVTPATFNMDLYEWSNHNKVGYIAPAFEDLYEWAKAWYDKAIEADADGMDLIVVLVPKAEVLFTDAYLDAPPDGPYLEALELFDNDFLRGLQV